MARTKRGSSRTVELYSERPIRTERDLSEFIAALDEDEGVRVDGSLRELVNGGFVFVGYYRGSYCVNMCDRVWSTKLRKHIPGGNDKWLYFDTAKEASDFVLRVAKRPLRAWLY